MSPAEINTKTRLVLLPGMDGTGLSFSPLLRELPDNFDPLVITYPAKAFLSYGQLTEYVRTRLPNEPFVLLAESFAGPIAYALARDSSVSIRLIVFCASFVTNPNKWLLAACRWLPVSRISGLPLPRILIDYCCFAGKARAENIQLFEECLSLVNKDVLSARLDSMDTLCEPAGDLDKRSLVLSVSQDRLVSPRARRYLAERCVNSIQYELDAPHFLLQTEPAKIAALLLSFVESSHRDRPNSDTVAPVGYALNPQN